MTPHLLSQLCQILVYSLPICVVTGQLVVIFGHVYYNAILYCKEMNIRNVSIFGFKKNISFSLEYLFEVQVVGTFISTTWMNFRKYLIQREVGAVISQNN